MERMICADDATGRTSMIVANSSERIEAFKRIVSSRLTVDFGSILWEDGCRMDAD
jgi:hypothetical protein